MNDFTNSSQNNIDTTNTGLLTSSTFPSTSRNWAIGGMVAAVVALVGLGAATIIAGGGNSIDAVSAAPAPVDSMVEAPAVPAVTVTPADTVAPTAATPAAPVTATPAPAAPAAASPASKVNEGPCPTYRSTNNLPLQLCDKGDWVSDVQTMLRPWNDISIDGHFGSQTERAVKYMQGELGFDQTGLVTQELLDVIAKLDPACNANGAMCDQPEEEAGHDDVHWGEGPHGDHMDDYSYDDYCNDILFDATHAQDMLDVNEQEVAECEAWFAL